MLRTLFHAALSGATLVAALLLADPAAAQSARPTRRAANQPVKSTKPVAKLATKPAAEAAPGTYQLVRLTQKVTVSITTDALTEIERRRQDTDEVSWIISPYAKVRILPRRVINAPGFEPLAPVANIY